MIRGVSLCVLLSTGMMFSHATAFLLPYGKCISRGQYLVRQIQNPNPFNSSLRTASNKSVTGTVYEREQEYPVIKLFTKEGCTLCDKVKDVLLEIVNEYPHSLLQVDITDHEHTEWFARYKYDIPVLHMNDIYWTKHRLSKDDAVSALLEARQAVFSMRKGEPNAAKWEKLN
jgi:thiol-disulfide isomerase/thioredoxin